jgi:hypothetical protein
MTERPAGNGRPARLRGAALLGALIASGRANEIRKCAADGEFADLSPEELEEILEVALDLCSSVSVLAAREALLGESDRSSGIQNDIIS